MRKRWMKVLHQLAVADERIVFVGSDLSAGSDVKAFASAIGDRFLMEGISEAHAVGMAAGLAMSGRIVYVNTIATFLTRRCFEQNVVDLGLANANVRLIGNGGGLVYSPLGPTHMALDDIAIMRTIPNMAIAVPADAEEMERLIRGTVDHQGPIYIRVAKGSDPVVSRPEFGFEFGKAIVMKPLGEVLLISTGTMTHAALAASDVLSPGLGTGVVHVHTVKPLDERALLDAITKARVVVSLEEATLNGGLGSAVAELIAEAGLEQPVAFKRLAIPDVFPDEYGSQNSLKEKYGLGVSSIVKTVQALHSRSPKTSSAVRYASSPLPLAP